MFSYTFGYDKDGIINAGRITVIATSEEEAREMAKRRAPQAIVLLGVSSETDTDDDVCNSNPWHTPKLCKCFLDENFSGEEIIRLEAEINAIFQRMFSFSWKKMNDSVEVEVFSVEEYLNNPVARIRQGDPKGFMGKLFANARGFYHNLENKPIAKAMWLWASFDFIVLSNSTDLVAQRYRKALWEAFVPSFVQSKLSKIA